MSIVTNGGQIIIGGLGTPLIPCKGGYVSNVGIDLSSGTFKMVQADGSDFTTSSEGHISMSSTTSGRNVRLTVTDATHFFEDSNGTHDFGSGEHFGKDNAAWGNDMPLYLYAVNSDDTSSGLKFAFSPDPTRTNSPPTAARTGYHGNPTSGGIDQSFFYLTSTDVTSSHVNKPCMAIGSFRGTKDASGVWTVTALGLQDGIGKYQDSFEFTFPTLQMGADSGYLTDAGGTAPVFATETYKYWLDPISGVCRCQVKLDDDGGTDGSGAIQTYMAVPYVPFYSTTSYPNHGRLNLPGQEYNFQSVLASDGRFLIRRPILSGSNLTNVQQNIQHANFTNGARNIRINFEYQAF